MKKCIFLLLLFVVVCSCTQSDTIIVDLSQKGNDVPKSMYGLFFEEINHAGDGGLYAELIQNRGFEEHVIPGGMAYRDGKVYAPIACNYYGMDTVNAHFDWDIATKKFWAWSVVNTKCMSSKEVLIPATPLHKNTPHAFQLKISDMQEGGKVELINSGYWGIAVKQGAKYDLRFYLSASDYKGTVRAYIYDPVLNTDVVSQTFEVNNNGQWVEYTAELTAGKTISKGDFRLEFSSPGTILIDYVSLFPRDTFKGHKNGLRRDIAEFLEDLKPAFMRWPGGCIVEGLTLENRVKWKETIGDPMTRPGEFSLWGYRSTWGMGYHEFLQFCEDIGMDAMFVANAGMACAIRNGDYVHGEAALAPFLDDMRDAIEYAIGDVTTEWGAKRAANGHPEPFPLKYVEIGNENGTERYVENFNYFYKVLKQEYPQITFINTLAWWFGEIEKVEKTDMIDPHWYENPAYFFNSTHLFDEVERGKFDVYVGEYACNNGVGKGNMEAALSEAAFIFGMERNSDLVTMTSYAPLISNDNQPNWACNLIWINNDQIMGRASYYVQKMFADNRPDYNVGISKLTTEPKSKLIEPGSVGVGSWNTEVEYKDIRITTDGQTRNLDISQFTAEKGEWVLKNDILSQTSRQASAQRIFKGFSGDNYTLELKARKTGGNEGFFIYYGMTEDGQKGYVFNIGGWNNSATNIERITNGGTSGSLGQSVRQNIETDRWYDIKVVVTPRMVELYMDGKLIMGGEGQAYPLQFFASGYDEEAGELVLKVVNAEEKPYKVEFQLDGTQGVEKIGKVITLKANALDEENSFEDPQKIYPQESEYGKFGKLFNYEFAPFSYTILRVKVKK